MTRTKITAHRGYCKAHLENTIPAFEEALQRGCDRIEFDLHYSKDRRLVVHHDYCVATKGGERRPIMEVCLSEMPPAFPLFHHVLELINGRVELEIELKGCSVHFIEAVLEQVQRYEVLDRVEFTSPHCYVLSHLRASLRDAKLGTHLTNMVISPHQMQ